MLTLVIGGARSGKSRFAQSLPAQSARVAYIATARCEDAEMEERVAQHRRDRPTHWVTIEEPLEIARAVERLGDSFDFILIECLTLWLSNFSWEHRESDAASLRAAASREVAGAIAAAGDAHLVLVTNEVGCGLVPETPVGRLFRDLQGLVNQDVARLADWVYHTVAGIPVPIKRPEGSR
jgi:adenosylcobinamide kinase/adenosylcobinamide-phosphate guanylyltransferase